MCDDVIAHNVTKTQNISCVPDDNVKRTYTYIVYVEFERSNQYQRVT